MLFGVEKMEYRVIRSGRRTIAIQIGPDGEVTVRAPRRMRGEQIAAFVESKRGWIEKHLPRQTQPKLTRDQVTELALRAKTVVAERVARYAPLVGVTYGRVTIRSQHTRWGSCSGKGNLNFNCLLMLVPEEVMDYVIVHELCHRKEMNHSASFWAQVERVLPDYRERRKWLKENGQALIGRLP